MSYGFSQLETQNLKIDLRHAWLNTAVQLVGKKIRSSKELPWNLYTVWHKVLKNSKQANSSSFSTYFMISSLSLQQVFTPAVTSCINIREFLKDTTMAESHENVVWKSEFTFFQRLYSNFNSLTLSSASELFWSWISINHIQVHENDFCHCLFTDTQNVKLGIFTGSRAVDSKEMYKKAWCTCKVVVLHCHAIAYLTFSSPPHLKLPIIYITSIYLSSRDKHSDQNNCQSLIEATKPQR